MKKISLVILVLASIASSTRWATANLMADMVAIPTEINYILNFVNTVSGFVMGVLEVTSVAYVLSKVTHIPPYTERPPSKRWPNGHRIVNLQFWVPVIGVTIILAVTPVAQTPVLVARMKGIGISEELTVAWMRYVWALCISIAPVLVVAVVAAVDFDFKTEKAKPPITTIEEKPVAKKPPVKKQLRYKDLVFPVRMALRTMTVEDIVKKHGCSDKSAKKWRLASEVEYKASLSLPAKA